MPYTYKTRYVLTPQGMKKQIVRKKTRKVSIPTPPGTPIQPVNDPEFRAFRADLLSSPEAVQRLKQSRPFSSQEIAERWEKHKAKEEFDTDQSIKMDEIE